MDRNGSLELLFQHASRLEFDDFGKLFSELRPVLADDELREAYLMRAQIKLYATDATIIGDLEKAAALDGSPRYPCLCRQWPADNLNRFIVFPKTSGTLYGFLQILPRVREELSKWYGAQGGIAVRQIQCEIYYFLGEIGEALACAEEQHKTEFENPIDAALSLCLLFRCYLALGLSEKAEKCMLKLIRLSQNRPESLASYRSLRAWANLTTGWSGETPRFYNTPGGKQLPVLEDRLKNIRMGSARTTPLEKPFVRYAQHSYEEAYALRKYYMDLFHAMYWFQMEDYKQAESYFSQLYRVAAASGLFMPFVECGKQITPLLQHMKHIAAPSSHDWIAMVFALAEQYEKSLNVYRG